MLVSTEHKAAMDEIRDLIKRASDCFQSDIACHVEDRARITTDDQAVWHHRQLTLAMMIRWQILDIANEFFMHYAAHGVKPKLFGKLAAIRAIVVKLGDEFPASRMEADRLLGEANDRLNYLSVLMESEHVF